MRLKPRCEHASPIGADGKRGCALGRYGGRVDKLRECQSCAAHVAMVALGTSRATAPAPRPEPPDACAHFRELSGAEREARGLAHGKRWGLCLLDARPLGEVVCPCSGCGPKCSGYSSG